MSTTLSYITKQELLLSITSFTGIYTLLIYCFSLGYYDFFLLPSIYFSIDTSLLISNGIMLLIIFGILILPYIILIPFLLKIDRYTTNTRAFKDITFKIPNAYKKFILIFLFLIIIAIIILFLYENATFPLITIALLCALVIYLVFVNKESKALYFAGLIILALLFMGGSYYVGNELAKSSTSHAITTYNNQEYIIIKEFKDHYVVAPISLAKNEIIPTFQLIPLSNENLKIHLKSSEPLKINLK